MSDLISRDKIVQAVVKNPNMTASELYSLIVDTPVEFDADKVVERMKKYASCLDDDNDADIVADDLIAMVQEGAVKDE